MDAFDEGYHETSGLVQYGDRMTSKETSKQSMPKCQWFSKHWIDESENMTESRYEIFVEAVEHQLHERKRDLILETCHRKGRGVSKASLTYPPNARAALHRQSSKHRLCLVLTISNALYTLGMGKEQMSIKSAPFRSRVHVTLSHVARSEQEVGTTNGTEVRLQKDVQIVMPRGGAKRK